VSDINQTTPWGERHLLLLNVWEWEKLRVALSDGLFVTDSIIAGEQESIERFDMNLNESKKVLIKALSLFIVSLELHEIESNHQHRETV